jgi:hypothetical protein
MEDDNDYVVMRSIAQTINLTSHQLGKSLQDAGLRDASGEPTMKAKLGDWIKPYRLKCGLTAFKWNREKVLEWWKKRPQATETKQDTRKRTK